VHELSPDGVAAFTIHAALTRAREAGAPAGRAAAAAAAPSRATCSSRLVGAAAAGDVAIFVLAELLFADSGWGRSMELGRLGPMMMSAVAGAARYGVAG